MTLLRRPLLLALSLALAAPLPPAWAQGAQALPSLGESASDDLSVRDEARLGQRIMREVRRDPAYLDDPVLLAYLDSVFQPLVTAAREQGQIGTDIDAAFAWEAFLVLDPSVNAFALPGGYMGVHLGLIAMTESADELASVLAHELAHVTQRHIARSLGSAQRSGMVGAAAMLLALLAAGRSGNADVAQAAIVGGQAAMAQGQLNFSRDMEREADRIGFGLLTGSGHSARGMEAMFQQLAFANRLNDNGAYPYLRSHPLTTERISEARERVPPQAPPMAHSLEHELMRARARVLMAGTSDALRRLRDGPGGPLAGPQRWAALYAQALAASRLHDEAAARRALGALASASGEALSEPAARRCLDRLAAEVWLSFGQPVPAAQALAQDDAASGRPGLMLRADLALASPADASAEAAGRLRRTTEALQVWTAEHPADALAWSALARTARAGGLVWRARRADAEARAAIGDLPGAVQRLRSAQHAAAGDRNADPIELQVIDARLRTLDAELHAEREEARSQSGPR